MIRGTFRIVVRPGARSAAAMCLSAAFLAPATRTDPVSLAPPVTRRRSIARSYRQDPSARGDPSAGCGARGGLCQLVPERAEDLELGAVLRPTGGPLHPDERVDR